MANNIAAANIVDIDTLAEVVKNAKKLAIKYHVITGKPLGITGEVGEFAAADLLGLTLTGARNPGYDAVGKDGRKIQIKTRRVLPGSKPGQRLGVIKRNYGWDTVMLVMLDHDFEPSAIYEAQRADIERELDKPGSRSRERGALGINKFRAIAKKVWPKSK